MKKQPTKTENNTTSIWSGENFAKQINGAINELNVLINQPAAARDLNRIESLFIELTGNPTPQSILNIL